MRVIVVNDETGDAARRDLERREAGKPSPNDKSQQRRELPGGRPNTLSDAWDIYSEGFSRLEAHAVEFPGKVRDALSKQIEAAASTAKRLATKDSLIDRPIEQARKFVDMRLGKR